MAIKDKILAALAALSDRMHMMVSFQKEADEDERMCDAIESGLFPSALGANIGAKTMKIDMLRDSQERNQHLVNHEQLACVRCKYQCASSPTPIAPARHQEGLCFATPTAVQRKLTIRKFDCT
ncbi:unnamed protein product [Peronospora belbahrii]|uniref:Uncharacterized protein n=1 Tax=Peronospora belbahrii TaxID=622444 RepID=A0AAU9KQK3_9STRA|nr:unnamed protein product [Peronospora belbahrii]